MDATKGTKNGTTHVLFAKFGGSKSLIDGKLLSTLWKNSQNVIKRATKFNFFDIQCLFKNARFMQ